MSKETKHEITHQYLVTVYANGEIKMTERNLTRRDSRGKFAGKPSHGGYCRWYGECPFTTKGR